MSVRRSSSEPGGGGKADRVRRAVRLCLLAWASLSGAAWAQPDAGACPPSAALDFLCGAEKPEDLAEIPGTPWLIASGFSLGAGLKLVDTGSRDLRLWYTGAAEQVAPDRAAFPDCDTPPDPALFMPRGLSLRVLGAEGHRLHAVNHGGRESVEIFDIDPRGEVPQLRWRGCVKMPERMVGNSVATFSDGTILVTVLTRPGTTIADFLRGLPTGTVLERRPGQRGWRELPGTQLPGNNGIATAPDDRRFWVVAFGWHSIVEYRRSSTAEPARRILAPDFMPDNIHWSGGRLLTAGMRHFEPACGGLRRIVGGVADPMLCHRGYVVAALDPRTGRLATIVDSNPDPSFNGVSAASIVGDMLWLGSYQADRLAWRPLTPRSAESTPRE
jgi:hypothetical protein